MPLECICVTRLSSSRFTSTSCILSSWICYLLRLDHRLYQTQPAGGCIHSGACCSIICKPSRTCRRKFCRTHARAQMAGPEKQLRQPALPPANGPLERRPQPPECTIVTSTRPAKIRTLRRRSCPGSPVPSRESSSPAPRQQIRDRHHQQRNQQKSNGIGNRLDAAPTASASPQRGRSSTPPAPGRRTGRTASKRSGRKPCASPPITDAASTITMAQSTHVIWLALRHFCLQTQIPPRQAAEGFKILVLRPLHNFVRQTRRGRLLVPMD